MVKDGFRPIKAKESTSGYKREGNGADRVVKGAPKKNICSTCSKGGFSEIWGLNIAGGG